MRNPFARILLLLFLLGIAFSPAHSYPFQDDQKTDPSTQNEKTSTEKTPPSESREALEEWQVLYLKGTRIGFGRSLIEPIVVQGRDLWRTLNEQTMVIRRLGQKLVLRTKLETIEDDRGRVLSFVFQLHNVTGAGSKTTTTGRLASGKMELTMRTGGRTTTRTIEIPADAKGPRFIDNDLRTKIMEPGEVREFIQFMPELADVSKVTMRAKEKVETKLLEGKAEALEVELEIEKIPGVITHNFIDEQGGAIKVEADLLGSKMISYRVDRAEAEKTIEGEELDLALETLIRAELPKGHETTKAVYEIRLVGSNQPEKAFLADGTQSIEKIAADTIKLTVISVNPGEAPAEPEPVTEADRNESGFLQSTDEKVQAHAKKACSEETDPAKQAILMEKYVHKNLKKKNFSTALASAAEVAENLEGDCTEHACLLAAMCRSRGIPARVAIGLVYVESLEAFGGHMWTEAYLNGRWVPLDGTLGRGGIGAGHIKLATSNLSEDVVTPLTCFLPVLNMGPKMKIKVLEAE